MNDKGVQVAIGSKRPRQTSTVTQAPVEVLKKDQGTQCGMAKGSYSREGEHRNGGTMTSLLDFTIKTLSLNG